MRGIELNGYTYIRNTDYGNFLKKMSITIHSTLACSSKSIESYDKAGL